MPDWDDTAPPWEPNKDHITGVVLVNIRNVGNYAFDGYTRIGTVDLGMASVVGEHAFDGCTSLGSIDLDGVTELEEFAFQGCTSLTEVTVPGSIESIPEGCFKDCTGLQRAVIGSDEIGYEAFAGCDDIRYVDMREASSIDNAAFGDTQFYGIDLSESDPEPGIWAGPGSVDGTTTLYPPFTVNVRVSPEGANRHFGSVTGDRTIFSVLYGEEVEFTSSATGGTAVVGDTTVTATPDEDTAQYSYRMTKWKANGQDATGTFTVTDDTTIDAFFSRSTKTYAVSAEASSYGTVSVQSVTGVAYGSSVTVDGAVLSLGSKTVTAMPDDATAQYTYTFSKWQMRTGTNASWHDIASGETTDESTSFKAVFARTTNDYGIAVTVSGGDHGSVYPLSASVPYGTTLAVEGDTLKAVLDGETKATFAATKTNEDGGTVTVAWTVGGEDAHGKTVSGDTAVTATFTYTANAHTVTIVAGEHGSVQPTQVAVHSGDEISVEDETITVAGIVVTATPDADSASYAYAFAGWFVGDAELKDGTVVEGDMTVTAKFSYSVRTYTVIVTAGDNGSVSTGRIDNVPHGTALTADGDSLKIGTVATITATPSEGYATRWNAPATVTEDITVSASFPEIRTYKVVYMSEGKEVHTQSVTTSEDAAEITLEFPSVSRMFHELKGWNDKDGNPVEDGSTVTVSEEDVVLTAVWEQKDISGWLHWILIVIGAILCIIGLLWCLFPLIPIGLIIAGAGVLQLLGIIDIMGWL